MTCGICTGSPSCFLQNGDLLLEWLLITFLLTLHTADGCRHWERHSGAMEIQAQWAAKLLQEYQRRAEASGFPGPHTGVSQPSKESPVKTVRGMRNLSCVVRGHFSGSANSSIKLKSGDCFFLLVYFADGQSSPKSNSAEQAGRRNSARAPAGSSLKRLRSSCMVIRMDDVDIRQARSNHQLIQFCY